MKTLFITQDFSPESGGIARLYGELCRNFPASSVVVSTVTASGEQPVPPNLEIVRMPWTRAQAKRYQTILRWRRWVATRAKEFDVIQVGNIRPTGYIGVWAKSRFDIPYVMYVHGKDLLKEMRRSRESLRVRWTAKRIMGGASAIIANSENTAELARELLRQLKCTNLDCVHVVHPATDPAVFSRDEAGAVAWRKQLNIAGPLLLSVSRLMPRKGIDTVLKALVDLPEARYVIGGTGPDLMRLELLARELGVEDRVIFLGEVPDTELPALYTASDLFVLPVREDRSDDEVEGFGIVYCEASACGVAVIGGASGGVADAVRDGETGVLVPPNDPAALRAQIARLLADPAERQRLGDNGRRYAATYYNWQRAAREAWAIIEDVVPAAPSR